MNPESNPYRSPNERSDTGRKGWMLALAVVAAAFACILSPVSLAAGALIVVCAVIWLLARGAKDGAYSDPMLFLTGVSFFAYVIGRWDRARLPIFVFVGGVMVMILGEMIVFE